MDLYALLKFLHVVSAIIWLGGGFMTVVIAHSAVRAGDGQKIVDVVRQVAWCAERVLVPSSLATLLFGVAVTWYGSLWTQLWVILALIGIVATLALGIGVLSPRAKKVAEASGAVTPAIVGTARQVVAIATFDIVLLFAIVADMVLKPQPGDWSVLAPMAAAVILAGLWLLGQLRRPSVVAAA